MCVFTVVEQIIAACVIHGVATILISLFDVSCVGGG